MRRKRVVFVLVILGLVLGGSVFFCKDKDFFTGDSFLPSPFSSREKNEFLLIKELNKAKIEISRGPVWESKIQGVKIYTKEGTEVIFSLEKDVSLQVASLQLILKKSKIVDGTTRVPKLIDLRAENPYVTF